MSDRDAHRAMFVSFEGVEAVGKSTAIQVAGEILNERGVSWISTREPGGTPLAEALRKLVLGKHEERVSDVSELLMMFAARAQSVAEVIRPALAAGQLVLCDRFTDATLAYQGAGRGFDSDRIRILADWVHGDLWPHRTYLLQAQAAVVAARMDARQAGRDRIEQQTDTFFARVARGYETLADADPDRFTVVDTSGTVQSLRDTLAVHLDHMLAERAAR